MVMQGSALLILPARDVDLLRRDRPREPTSVVEL